MSYLQRNGYRIYFQWEGEPGAPVLMLSHSLGANQSMWDPQVKVLRKSFHILLYDHPGHGKSDCKPEDSTIADFGTDVLALLDTLKLDRVGFCGLSLGGMIGIWLGAIAPERITRLFICSSAARIENPDLLRNRIRLVRREGISAITDSVLSNWFTPEFVSNYPDSVDRARRMLMNTQSEAYASTAETVCNLDLHNELRRIRIPVLVMYGNADRATPPEWNLFIHDQIKHSLVCKVQAAHMANIEAADDFTARLMEFFQSQNNQLT